MTFFPGATAATAITARVRPVRRWRCAAARVALGRPVPGAALSRALVLSCSGEGPQGEWQRAGGLAEDALVVARERVNDSPAGDLATFVVDCACASRLAGAGGVSVGPAVRGAALGLISALGEIADGRSDARDDSPAHSLARELTVRELPTCVAGMLAACVRSAEGVSEEDLALSRSPMGVLFRPGGG